MANYYAYARSNYFKVKDAAAFAAWAEKLGLTPVKRSSEDLFSLNTHELETGWPSYRIRSDSDEPTQEYEFEEDESEDLAPEEEQSLDLAAELSAHLVPGETAVLMEIGHEKMRYLTGSAIAVHADGRFVDVSLERVYELAAKEFDIDSENISHCSY